MRRLTMGDVRDVLGIRTLPQARWPNFDWFEKIEWGPYRELWVGGISDRKDGWCDQEVEVYFYHFDWRVATVYMVAHLREDSLPDQPRYKWAIHKVDYATGWFTKGGRGPKDWVSHEFSDFLFY